jgi:hypothetical protein
MPTSTFSSLRNLVVRFHLNLVAALCAALVLGAVLAGAQTTYNGGGAISISGANASGSSALSVTGASGSVKTVQVTLNGVTSNGQSYNSV